MAKGWFSPTMTRVVAELRALASIRYEGWLQGTNHRASRHPYWKQRDLTLFAADKVELSPLHEGRDRRRWPETW